MTRPVVWPRKAEAELRKAEAWYAAIRPELAEDFGEAINEALRLIASDPEHFAVVANGRRRAGIRRFPYGLFFLVEPERIVIVACLHAKRNPKRWETRVVR